MNVLENYIKEIISEEDIPVEETKKYGLPGEYVRIKAVVHCYGNANEIDDIWLQSRWENAKRQGYYMA